MDAATVDHQGRTTAYRLRDAGGDGPTVLCVHGSGGSHAVWRGQFRLARDYPVAALDLSGHGESDDVDADAGYEALSAYVDDVVAVAEATDASVLVGNSLGGAVVLTLALERDLDVDALVLAGTGAKLAVLDDLLDWLDDDFERAVSFLHGEDKLFHGDDERLIDGSKEAMYDAGQAVTNRDFRSCHTFDVRDEIAEITVPTLALVGEYDRLTPPSYHEYFVDEIPNCELATIEDAAHLAMLEQPQAFNTALKSFLDRHVE
ncbi:MULTISPECIES: alpha/beta fold hydrolase [Haloferax]|uniref:Alpha/beta fold hydrolase n=1 Tax=Haloferax marinum TaxID=2666143 RepID=A0A6A8GD08_9EURY|nr:MULTISPECIES: alpha/beta hydrolase [Haloferax]KAB1198738.1 alpha/beta hydrolase [Haloferax sp. CBA1150]MRW97856.1 alpha/beta fold hydrolase [Haloferax marinum]